MRCLQTAGWVLLLLGYFKNKLSVCPLGICHPSLKWTWRLLGCACGISGGEVMSLGYVQVSCVHWVCTCECIYLRTHVCMCIFSTCMYIHTRTCTCTCMYVCVRMYAFSTCMYMYIHTYMYVCVCMYECVIYVFGKGHSVASWLSPLPPLSTGWRRFTEHQSLCGGRAHPWDCLDTCVHYYWSCWLNCRSCAHSCQSHVEPIAQWMCSRQWILLFWFV